MKNKILGIPIMALVLGLLIVGGAMAALVSYLSNTATSTVEVKSALDIKMANANSWDGVEAGITEINGLSNDAWVYDLVITETTALSTSYLGLYIKNNADVSISDEILEIRISNELDTVTCVDLTSIKFTDVGCSEGTSCYQIEQELIGVPCTVANNIATYSVPIKLLHPGQTYKYPVKLTFGNVALDTYTFDAQLVLKIQ